MTHEVATVAIGSGTDVAMENIGVTLGKGDLRGIPHVRACRKQRKPVVLDGVEAEVCIPIGDIG